MKNSLTLILLFINAFAFGQNNIRSGETLSHQKDTIFSTSQIDGLAFLKVISGNKQSIYLSIALQSTTAIEKSAGANILLSNGKTINKSDAVITVKPIENSNRYTYSALIELTENDIFLFSTYPVFRFRLYVYYNDVKQGDKLKAELVKLLSRF
jgi:predicted permease